MNQESALNNLVRIGRVSSVDESNGTARVTFDDKQDTDGNPLISAPLKVLERENPWLPHVRQFVVCLYLPNGESDGFVLGAI